MVGNERDNTYRMVEGHTTHVINFSSFCHVGHSSHTLFIVDKVAGWNLSANFKTGNNNWSRNYNYFPPIKKLTYLTIYFMQTTEKQSSNCISFLFVYWICAIYSSGKCRMHDASILNSSICMSTMSTIVEQLVAVSWMVAVVLLMAVGTWLSGVYTRLQLLIIGLAEMRTNLMCTQ